VCVCVCVCVRVHERERERERGEREREPSAITSFSSTQSFRLASQAHTVFDYTFIPDPVPIHTTQIPHGSNLGMCVEKPATNYMAWPIHCLIIQIHS
jgi:hypothetical protein